MQLKYFPDFVKNNFQDTGLTDSELINIGRAFREYLNYIFQGDRRILNPIWDIKPETVSKNIDNPYRTNGYHSALIIYFANFCKELSNDMQNH